MRVGILCSGLMGGKLGTLFASAGHAVMFSYADKTYHLGVSDLSRIQLIKLGWIEEVLI